MTPMRRSCSSASSFLRFACAVSSIEVGHFVDLEDLHAPLYAARHDAVLGSAEIVPGARAQQGRDLGQVIRSLLADAVSPSARRSP